jgi:geranylgeranyl pyrophosphate synthase
VTVTQADREWMSGQAASVLQQASEAIDRHAQERRHANLLQTILKSVTVGKGQDGGVCRTAVQLPLLVHVGIRGELDEKANDLACALALLEAGIYTLDHIMDHELDAPLNHLPETSILLGAACLLSHLPYQILVSAFAPDASAVALVGMLADGLANISAGQSLDIASTANGFPDSTSVYRAVSMKTGARRALYAAMGATLAGGTAEQIAAYTEYGHSLGVARQLRSDLVDLFGSRPSRDLASSTLTLPVVLYLERVDVARREEMRALFEQSPSAPDTQRNICILLRDSGVMREVVARIEQHCKHALAQIAAVRPLGRAASLLWDAALSVSLARA